MKTKVFDSDITAAAEIIKSGGLVAVPTETVYGLAANGLDETAVSKIYDVKGRPSIKPLSFMISGADQMSEYCEEIPEAAYVLAERFWPGPLTIVLRASGRVPDIVVAGGITLGLRCPASDKTRSLIELSGCPLAAPSANPSGCPSPKSAEEVLDYYDGVIDGVIDGGACAVGIESTVVDLSIIPFSFIRKGALPEEEVISSLRDALTVIGITGGSGTGKTTAMQPLQEMGALLIDCDAVYHELLETNEQMLAKIDERFPGTVDGAELDRKKLGEIVFSDKDALCDLNKITHKYIEAEVEKRLANWAICGGRIAVIDAVALIESGLAKKCGAVVGIVAPFEERIRRICRREGISQSYAKLRIQAQPDDDYYKKNCGYILNNDGSAESFREKCEELFGKVLGRS